MPETPLPRLLLVSQDQFGYLTDSYQYCRHLRRDFAITYIGWDYGLEAIQLEGVRVVNLSREGNKFQRVVAFLRDAIHEVRSGGYDLIIVEQFPFCSFLPVFGGHRRRMILDIRTGYVRDSVPMRVLVNAMITMESLAFPHVAIISESLRRFLGITAGKSFVLPLGAEVLDLPPKDFSRLRLFYVGSLDHRHIDETVRGVDGFVRNHGGEAGVTYDIVGFGSPKVEQQLRDAIAATKEPGRIIFHGRIPNTGLRPYLERATVGVAFIPLKKHYDCQPATKVFEYLLAGMAVLATRTSENMRVIDPGNGAVIDDTAASFTEGLENLWKRLGSFDSGRIAAGSAAYAWERIVRDTLRPFLVHSLQRHGSAGRRRRNSNWTTTKEPV